MRRRKLDLAISIRFPLEFFPRSADRSEKLRARAAYRYARVSQAADSADSIRTRRGRPGQESAHKPTWLHGIATSLSLSRLETKAAAMLSPTSPLSQRDRQKSIPRAAAWWPHVRVDSADKTSDPP